MQLQIGFIDYSLSLTSNLSNKNQVDLISGYNNLKSWLGQHNAFIIKMTHYF